MQQEPDEVSVRDVDGDKRVRGKSVMLFLVVFLVACFACWHIHLPKHDLPKRDLPKRDLGPKPGAWCTVQLRRDVLGRAADLPVSAMAQTINGAQVAICGELIAADGEAILLNYRNERITANGETKISQVWIPRSNILLIEYEE